MNPRVRGGPWGPTPRRASLATVPRPPCLGGPWGLGQRPVFKVLKIPLGAMGTMANGGWPKGPWPPCWGEIHSREATPGSSTSPPVPLGVSSPDGPPDPGARLRTAPKGAGSHLLEVTIPILPIFTSHIVDSFLPIACCRLQSSILSNIRPPEESLHQTCRAFRAESDSSTLEASGGF